MNEAIFLKLAKKRILHNVQRCANNNSNDAQMAQSHFTIKHPLFLDPILFNHSFSNVSDNRDRM